MSQRWTHALAVKGQEEDALKEQGLKGKTSVSMAPPPRYTSVHETPVLIHPAPSPDVPSWPTSPPPSISLVSALETHSTSTSSRSVTMDAWIGG